MPLEELYKLMKDQLLYMYEHNKDSVVLGQMEFFAVFKAVCDLMQIKHITDKQ